MTAPQATGSSTCHTGIDSATPHGPAQTLSFMEPAARPAPVRSTVTSIRLPDAPPAAAPEADPSLDPPPPRLV